MTEDPHEVAAAKFLAVFEQREQDRHDMMRAHGSEDQLMDDHGYLFEIHDEDNLGGLDKRCLQIAKDLYAAGWKEEAVEIAGSLAEIREGIGSPTDWSKAGLTEVYDQLFMVSTSAARIVHILHNCYPDGIALKQ